MKTLIISFGIWVFVVPAVVAVFLIFTFIAFRNPDLYFAFAALALALSILAIASGLSWLAPFSIGSVQSFPRTQQRPNPIQEIKHEKSFEGQFRL
jgi:hypothetical protein